jgi:hypothetical protein
VACSPRPASAGFDDRPAGALLFPGFSFMLDDPNDLGIVDTSLLTDDDWATINKLRRIYASEGQKGLSKAMRELDPSHYIKVMSAFFPDEVREVVKDEMAALGITEEDVKELAKKLDPLPTKQ